MMHAKEPQDSSALLKRALSAIDQLQAKLAQIELERHEPIAIVGIGCRFPGADGADMFWRNLVEGVDSVTEVPPSRWDIEAVFDPDPDAIGKSYTKWGGFLKDVELFDAPFFGITPREAAYLDPQQRQVMEASWLALEDAGIAPSSVANTRTGVYLGLSGMDYIQMVARAHGTRAESFALSGTAHSIAGGRVSYFLGAQGPNISIDTACSSSLVAVHLAVKGLRTREADMALAGGVNITLLADASIITSRARMMSPTGRCNAFDASADGYVRSEGSAMIVLKRLSDAQKDGDRILALIRGTALNQDGRSSGLTAPHGPSQEAVVRAALEDAGLTANEIAFVEAHGTGTSLGDPIEVNALGNVFAGRPVDRPLVIGSVKANIGHAEAAAGMAGLIKAVQALRHRMLPPQLHVNTLNPMINWDGIPVRVALETTPLTPLPDTPLCCGVSSFGFSGTNAHAILQEAPPVATPDTLPHAADTSTMLAISARTPEALCELAGRYADLFEAVDAPSLRDVAAAAALSRSHFAERLGIVAADATEARTALRAIASGAKAANAVSGRMRAAAATEVVFLFTGQGAQYVGMSKGLYETEQVFREALDLCDELARPHLAHGLIDIMFGRNGAEGMLDDTTYTQPALFALEYALAQMWRAWGVEPIAVMGHSVGEYAAACIAGMLSLEDAMRLIIARGRLMGALPAGGAMAAVFAPEDVVRAAIAETAGRVAVAAVNGATNVVISGAAEDLEGVAARLEAKGIELQRLNVSHAFHSALMEPILDEFEEVAAAVRFHAPNITLLSNLTGARMGADGCSAAYWRRHLREAVRFSDSIAALYGEGYRVFLEIGPAPILAGMAQRCTTGDDAVYVPSLRRGRDDRRSTLEAAAHLYVAGARLRWPALQGPRRGHALLPTYPFQRTRHWIEGSALSSAASFAGQVSSHAMLGTKIAAPVDIYQTRLGTGLQPWTGDHRIFGFTPFPAAGFLELALAAVRECDGSDAALDDVTIGEGLLLPDTGAVEVQVVLTADTHGHRIAQVFSAAPDSEQAQWRLHMAARIGVRGEQQSKGLPASTQSFRTISPQAYYERISNLGAEFGPAFRCLRTMRRNGQELFADVTVPEGLTAGYILHPALLDACFHPLGICMETEEAEGSSTDLFMPVGARRYAVYRDGATVGTARVTAAPAAAGAHTVVADIALFDPEGVLIAEVVGLEFHRATRTTLERLMRRTGPQAEWRFGIDWRACPPDDGVFDLSGQNWLVFADAGGVADAFAAKMRAAGASIVLIQRPDVMDEKHVASAVAKAAPIYQPLHGAAFLWALDAPASFANADALDSAAMSVNAAALFAFRAVADRAARLLVATRGTQRVDRTESADLVQSSIWALAGVVAAEHPTCGLTRIDLAAEASSDADADALCAEAAATDMEDRIAHRGGQRYAARLTLGAPTPPAEQAPVLLDIRERGSLEQLAFVPLERRPPGPGEIELRVLATGLNFRDVLNVLGAYPGDPGPLGNECAGVVTAVGPGVTEFAMGDDVVAMVDRSFATYCVAPVAMCVRKPVRLTHQEAATVPVTFLTADHALHALANVKAGDRVLVHAVTGGVGMAATQIALRAGAIVYGTAGTAAKRALAKRLGVNLASDSRSLTFVDDILRETNGEGVDIVLNSLSGRFIPASLGLVRQGGTFVEIGKTDIWNAETVAENYPGVQYHPLYLGDVASADPAMMRARLGDILGEMEEGGALKPLPQTVFRFDEAEHAFRYVAQGLHTGKVVLTQQRGVAIRRDGAYVLTGGLTGLGLTTARWLAAQGAGGILLLGRRAPNQEALSAIAEMEASGTMVLAAQVDVGDTTSLAAALSEARQMGPIRGVIHAAGVLDDGMLSEQTPERFARVMAPKVRGGWALHSLTLADPLDFFILFSSGAALLGSPGQANYAAANGFLDGLAHHRRARGLPALSINWGSWAEVGMAAGVGADHHRRWSAMGLEMITPKFGMDMLAEMMASGAGPQVAAVPLVRTRLPARLAPFYRELVTGQAAQADQPLQIDIIGDLRSAEASERQSMLNAFLADQVQRALALPASQAVDRHESLLNLGMDSLMAMELRNRLLSTIGVRMAVADLLEGASVTDIGRVLMRQLVFDDAKQIPVAAGAGWEEGRL